MSYFVPVRHTDRDIFKNEGNSSRYLKVVIDPAGSANAFAPMKINCTASVDYQKWSMVIKNRTGITVGYLANEPCIVQVSGDGSYWYTIFTGYVSDAGFHRTRGYVTDDYISLDMVDATQRKGTKRKPDPALLSGFAISNPSNPSSSILHYLAALMGVNVEAFPMEYTKDIVDVGNDTVWSELNKLKEAFGADMYFNHLGALRFVSQFDSDKTLTLIDSLDAEQPVTVIDSGGATLQLTLPSYTSSPEWLFQGDPNGSASGWASRIKGKVKEEYLPVRCNRAFCEFGDYEQLTSRIIYKNTEDYNPETDEISIEIAAGDYWPGDEANDVAQLNYKDPETGEQYPYAISVDTPSIGSTGTEDIYYTGGTLSIVSFNGSTSGTKQRPGASEIILQNTGATTVTIKRLMITGIPYRQTTKNEVKHTDASITDEVDYVDKTIDGKYATSESQLFTTLFNLVENQKGRVRRFKFSTAFLPWIQRRAIVQVQMPGESVVECRVDSYTHQNRSKTLMGMVTEIVCTEQDVYTPSGSPVVRRESTLNPLVEKLGSVSPNAGATYRLPSTNPPTNPAYGDLWYQTDTKLWKRYNGSSWDDVGASPLEKSTTEGVSFENASRKVRILDSGILEAVDGIFSGKVTAGSGSSVGYDYVTGKPTIPTTYKQAAMPASAIEGELWQDTDDGVYYRRNSGTAGDMTDWDEMKMVGMEKGSGFIAFQTVSGLFKVMTDGSIQATDGTFTGELTAKKILLDTSSYVFTLGNNVWSSGSNWSTPDQFGYHTWYFTSKLSGAVRLKFKYYAYGSYSASYTIKQNGSTIDSGSSLSSSLVQVTKDVSGITAGTTFRIDVYMDGGGSYGGAVQDVQMCVGNTFDSNDLVYLILKVF